MCGIVGIVGPQDAPLIQRMLGSMVHRGPDDAGVFRERETSLAMQRLAIIDHAGGHQPMQSRDGRYTIVYNGEIFNANDLRASLEKEGVRFRTDHSDTEVLLELLIREGRRALPKLNGMFAFALFDRQEQVLLCARDRFGIKPLYYSTLAGRFAFASELKSLLELPWIERKPDLQSVFHYFSLHYVPGAASAIDGVRRLEPGALLELNVATRGVVTEQWWQPTFGAGKVDKRELTERLSNVLAAAVDRWAIADVPIGCLLSGGLDSSTVVSLLAKRGHQLKTFTVGFTGPGEQAWDEMKLARLIATQYRTEHEEIVLEPESLLDDLADMVWSLDEPYGGGLPSWSVFKAMSGHVKVAMTGTGGDELFGNYNKYAGLEGRIAGFLPALARHSVDRERFDREFFRRYYYASDAQKRAALTAKFDASSDTESTLWMRFGAGGPDRALRDRVAATDLATQLPDEFLLMTDRFSMAYSIEARTPFLDNELAAEVFSIAAAQRLNPRLYKHLLRDVAAKLLPQDLMNAPKRGFVIPLKLWLRGRLQPLVRRLLDPRRLAEQGLVQPDFLERFAIPHFAQAADNTQRLWNMLMFQLWWDVFISRRSLDELRAEVRAAS